MIRKITLAIALFAFAIPSVAQLSGTYSIDATSAATSSNYQSVAAAVSDLTSGTRTDAGPVNGPGVSGPVTLRIVTGTGPYVEQITFPLITGVSATNTIRLTGGPGREMITFSGTTTADRHVIKLNGAKHIILDSLSLVNTDATYGYGVHITNSADSNTVKNCSVIVNNTATSTNFAGITISGATVTTGSDSGDDNLIQNNSVNGGYYGITMRGFSTTVFNQRNKIIGNTIQNVYFYGIYCYSQNEAQINSNIITARLTASTGAYGIYIGYTDLPQVEKNKISALGGYGIYCLYANYQTGTGTTRARIANNMIGGGWLATSPYGIYITTNSRNLDIWNNSVSLTSGNGRAIYILSGSGNDIKNNSFAVFGSTTGYAAYISATTYVSGVDYNNYYAPGSSNFIYIAAAYSTATFIGGGGFNTNSRNGDPVYQNNTTNLHTTALQLWDAGTNVGITDDIDGDARPLAPTSILDIGADEYNPSINDAGVSSLTSPVQPFAAGVQNVNVTVMNHGAATLTSATVNWKVNNVVQPTYAWTGSLTTFAQSSPVTIGTYNFLAGNTYNLKIWTSNPNGSTDQNNNNDTLTLTVCVSLNGVYTVGGVGADYPTLNAAVNALVCGGISGPVTMNLTQGAGPFNEQVVIPSIPGTSNTNTVRFNGGANRETVQYAATLTNLRGVFMISGADHIILDSMTIKATGTTYGYGVQMLNSADSNTVRNCMVYVDSTLTSANFSGITLSDATVATNADNGDGNLIENNIISGGYYGITMRGFSATAFNQNNKVINNTVRNFYYYGIYCYYQNQNIITNNKVTARAASTTAAYGIYMYYNDLFTCEKNKISSVGTYGIYAYYGNYQSGTGTTRATIINNMIGGTWRGTTPYGIYLSTNSRNIDIWHNSVSLDNGNGRALYITSGTGNDVRNNSFAVFGSASGYAAYITSTTNVTAFNYNNFYAPGSANFVYVGGAYTTSTYIGGGGFNLNSRDGNPNYVNNAGDLHAFAAQLYDAGTNLGINTDYDGDTRPLAPSTGYDIGADEYGILSNDITVVALLGPTTNSCADSNMTVTVIVTNNGLNTVNSLPLTAVVTGYTSATLNYTYTGSIVLGQTDTIVIGTINSHPGGNLNISAYSTLAGDQATGNDTVSAGITIIPIAAVAVGQNDTSCVGSTATVNVNADGYAHNWYDASSGGNQVGNGDTLVTPVLTSTTTYYVESVNSSNANMVTTYAGGNGCEGAMFDIDANVNITIDSFAVNIGSTVSETVRVFYCPVTYLGNETNMAAWTMIGQVNVIGAGAGQPTLVPLGGLNIPAGQSYGIYIALVSSNIDYTNGSQTFTNSDLSVITGAGLCNPFGGVNAGRIFNGTVYYTKEVCPNPVRTPITITVLTPPTIALGNDTTVCGSEMLDAGNPTLNFLWSTGDTIQQITATASGAYSVIVSDVHCSATDTIVLTVNPLPVLTTSVADGDICIGASDTMMVSGATLYAWSSGGISTTEIVSPAATTTYTVTGIDNNNCVDSAFVTINVNALPVIGYTAAPDSVCIGNQTSLSGSGASSYTWSGGISDGVPFTPASSGTYTVTGTDSNGCSDTASAMITVNPLPVIGYTASATTICANDPVTLSGTGASTYSWTGSVTDNTPFNPTATDTYTVTGTDINGCSDTTSVTINVNALPVVGYTSTATQVCAGDSVTLNGTGAVNYSWSGGINDGIAFAPTATATYTVTGTDANGCSNTDAATVVVNSLPNVTVSLGFSTICFDDANATLTGGLPVGGTWSGPGVSGGSFDPSVAGNGTQSIQYTYTDANGCTNNASQNVTVDPCTGIANANTAEHFYSVYPNPNNGQFTFLLNESATADVFIYDAIGQLVYAGKMQNGSNQIRIETAGLYLLRVISSNGKTASMQVIVD